jgi:GNAT superfamily N-acetyltransferase
MANNFAEIANLPFKAGTTQSWLNAHIADWDKIFIVNENSNRHIDGMLIGMAAPWILSNDVRVAMELCWWVDPEARGASTGLNLLKRYIEWAKEVGCQRIQMHGLVGDNIDKLDKLYKRMGFEKYEVGYVLNRGD